MSEPSNYQLTILAALARTGKHVYAGTANKNKVAKARRRNAQATINRRINLAKGA
jgi:hypothetical protein